MAEYSIHELAAATMNVGGVGQGAALTNAVTARSGVLDQIQLGNPSYVWRSGQERRLSMIRRYVSLEDARVLDIGCGIGAYVRRLSELSPQVYGVDIDTDRVTSGAGNGVTGLGAAVGEALPFANDCFDAVLLNEVIEHVESDRSTISEALRVIRPGGKVVIFAPNRFFPFETHGVYFRGRHRFGNIPLVNYLPNPIRNRLVPHARAYTRAGLRRTTQGLTAKWVDWQVIYPGFDNIVVCSRLLGRLARSVTYALESTWLKRFGLSHLLVLEKPCLRDH